MNKKISFDSEICLTAEELFAYTQAQSNAVLTRRVELHIADCPLCSDALEGLQESDNKHFTENHKNINLLLKEKYNPTKLIPLYSAMRWAAAASLAAFAIGFWWWSNAQKTENQPIAKNDTELKTNTSSTDSTDSKLATIAQDNLSPQKNKIPKGEKIIVSGSNTKTIKNTTVSDFDGIGTTASGEYTPTIGSATNATVSISPTTETSKMEEKEAPAVVAEASKPEETSNPMPSKPTSSVGYDDNQAKNLDNYPSNIYYPNPAKLPSAQSQDVSGIEEKRKPRKEGAEKAKSTANAKKNIEFSDLDEKKLLQGITFYQKNKPKEALVIFEELLKKDAENQNALFYKGAALALNEQYMEAISILSPFANSYPEGSPANAEATWISANCYVKLQQKESAKILLRQLVDFYNPRQDDAKRLLEKL